MKLVDVEIALLVRGVQQLVALVAVGLAQILFVDGLDLGVLVALAQGLGSILIVESLGAGNTDIGPVAHGGGHV